MNSVYTYFNDISIFYDAEFEELCNKPVLDRLQFVLAHQALTCAPAIKLCTGYVY